MSRLSRPARQILLLPLATIIALTCAGLAHARDPGPSPKGKAGAEIGERSEGAGLTKGQMLAQTGALLQPGAAGRMQAQADEEEARAASAQGQMSSAMGSQAAASAAGAAALGASLRASATAVAGSMSTMVSSTRAD